MEGSATGDGIHPTDDRDRTDLVEECRFLLASASDAGPTLRAMGGAAIAIRCPAAKSAPFARTYKDIDFATRSGANEELERLFGLAGYTSDLEFNAINAHRRLIFWDPRIERKVDVFVDRIEMCHALDIKDRLGLDRDTLPLADLLLLKLQIVEATDKDYVDALTLFVDHSVDASGIDGDYVAGLLANDWGWWRTATQNLERLLGYVPTLPAFPARDKVEGGIRHLLSKVKNAPKSRRWRMRARVGERKRWYELPEEVE
jgi:hypothetical protein